MLKGIDPLLNADVLRALRAMGHGDVIVVVDGNFPAESTARRTVSGELLRIDASAPRAVEAVLSVMPLDTFVDGAVRTMAVVDSPDEVQEVHREIAEVVRRAEGRDVPVERVERFAFYDLARAAYAILQVAEPRFYANFALVKGVVAPDG